MKTVGVILAAGSGSRTGLSVPKQFLPFGKDGKTVLEYSTEAFQLNEGITQIVIVTSLPFIERVQQMVADNRWSKVSNVIEGGMERYDSSLAAVRLFADEPDTIMLFHDAARPLVSQRIISDTIKAMEEYNAVDVAIPTADTIVQCDDCGSHMVSVPDRSLLWRMQTPQAFRQKTIALAYEKALQDPSFKATDDCGTVLRYLPEEKVGIVRGDERNMKLTYAEDLPLMESLL